MERVKMLVPVSTNANIAKGALLEYDSTEHVYKQHGAGTPVAVLAEAVTAGQTPAKALAIVGGPVYEDELASPPTQNSKAALQQSAIYVIKRK